MIKATINNSQEFTIDKNTLNGVDFEWDLLQVKENSFHILKHNRSYRATVVNINHEEKTLVLNINGNDYEVSIKDKYDLLLQQMGISGTTSTKINNFKAPMPGLIRELLLPVGNEVKKGDILLILEAMKMENALKSPRDGVIKRIAVEKGQAVDKGQVLVEFE